MTSLDEFSIPSIPADEELHLESFDIIFSDKTDLLDEAMELFGKTVKGDINLVNQITFNGLSAFITKPTHLMVMERTSEGKTYPALQISQYFPKDHVIKLGSVTPQAFKYELGTLVDKDYNPLQPQIDTLESQIDKATKCKNKTRVKELKLQKENLLKDSKTLVDLRNKWIIFKEPPDSTLLQGLYSTLSSDEEYNEHKFVNHSNGDGNKSFTVVFRGTPAILICTAKDETKSSRWSETFTRFHIVSPTQSSLKYKQGMDLIGKSYGLPKELYEEQVINEEDKTRLRVIITHFIKQIHESKGETFNPFQDELSKRFPNEAGYRWRQYQRFNNLLNVHCFCYSYHRPNLFINGRKIPILTKADVKWALDTIKESEIIPPNKITWFNEVFKETFSTKKQSVNFGTERNPLLRDVIISADLVVYTKEKNKGKVTTKQIRENFLETLSEHGFIETDKDPRNKSRQAYWISESYIEGKESSFVSVSSLDEVCIKSCLDYYLKQRFSFEFQNKQINQDELIRLILCEDNLTSNKNVAQEGKNISNFKSGEMTIGGDSLTSQTKNESDDGQNANTLTVTELEIRYSKVRKEEHSHFMCYTCNHRGSEPFKLEEKNPTTKKPILDNHLGHNLRFLKSGEAIEEIWSAKYQRPIKEKEIIAILNAGGD